MRAESGMVCRVSRNVLKRLLQEALVVALHQLAVDLAHQFERHTYCNQHSGSGKWERLNIANPQNDVRQDSDKRDEHCARQRDAVDRLCKKRLGLWPWANARNKATLLAQLICLTDWVEGNRVVEVRERNDQQEENADVQHVLAVDHVVVNKAGNRTAPTFGASEHVGAKNWEQQHAWFTFNGI